MRCKSAGSGTKCRRIPMPSRPVLASHRLHTRSRHNKMRSMRPHSLPAKQPDNMRLVKLEFPELDQRVAAPVSDERLVSRAPAWVDTRFVGEISVGKHRVA